MNLESRVKGHIRNLHHIVLIFLRSLNLPDILASDLNVEDAIIDVSLGLYDVLDRFNR